MRKIHFLVAAALLVTVLFSATIAQAQTSNYVVAKAGAYFPNSSDLSGFNTGFNGEVAAGHYFNRNFAAELGVGYFGSNGSGTVSNNSFTSSANGSLYAVPLTVAIKAIYPIDNWELYGMGGAGAYFCYAKADSASFGSESASATAFGGFLGAGANMNIDRYWFIGVEGKFLWAKPQFSVRGENFDVKFDGWTVTGNVGYRF